MSGSSHIRSVLILGSNIEIVIEFWMFIYQACYLFFVISMGQIQLKPDLHICNLRNDQFVSYKFTFDLICPSR